MLLQIPKVYLNIQQVEQVWKHCNMILPEFGLCLMQSLPPIAGLEILLAWAP